MRLHNQLPVPKPRLSPQRAAHWKSAAIRSGCSAWRRRREGAEALAALHHMLLAGSGNSIRALGSRPDAVANLLARRAPDGIVRMLAAARRANPSLGIEGIHLVTFGGVASAAGWANALLAAAQVPAR